MTEHIHTCNYECQKPDCIKAQRDELVKQFIKTPIDLGDFLKKKDDIILNSLVSVTIQSMVYCSNFPAEGKANIRFVFDGKTEQLINVEIIK